jgi:hypothetical protein
LNIPPFFPGIDPPESDPLFDLSLRVGRHCYGANLATAVLFVQIDVKTNRQNEDRFQITGMAYEGRVPSGLNAQKAAGLSVLNALLATWYPPATRPKVVDVFIPRRFAPHGRELLPPLIFIFSDSTIASQVCAKIINHLCTNPLPAMLRVWLEPILTKSTHVRIEILLAIPRILSSPEIRCTVQGGGRAPQLHIVSGGRERVFGFVPSCELFGHLLTADSLKFAYKSAGRSFINRLEATFLVLVDGAQPTTNFFVPAPRVVRLVIVAGSVVTDPPVDVRVPPPSVSTYLQRSLSSPIPSGSGRKRPAEDSNVSAKRAAP